MQCGVYIDEKEVFAVVLSDIGEYLQFSYSEIKCSLDGKYGQNGNKDFLRNDVNVPLIKRRKTDWRRRCFCFFLHALPSDQVEAIRKGASNVNSVSWL